MSLLEDLLLLKPKPYQPLYSGKIDPLFKLNHIPAEKLRNERPKTSNTIETPDITASPLRPISSTNNLSSRHSSRRIASVRNGSSLQKTFAETDKDDESVNISLFELDSENECDTIERKEYGKFNYFSYFERYMNRIAKRKIPSFLLPKPPPELEGKPDPTIYELLEEFELVEVYNQYDVYKALPPRIRSNSTGSTNKLRPNLTNSNRLRRRHSLECFINKYITQKLVLNSLEKKSKQNEKQSDKTSFKSLLTEVDNEKINNVPMGIKGPEIYGLGTMKLKKSTTSFDLKNKSLSLLVDQEPDDYFKKKYAHIESKLSKYFNENRNTRGTKSLTSLSRSRSAIQHHYDTSNSYQKPKTTFLKLSKQLDSKIREDIHRNKGPIYFGEMKEDNLNIHNEFKTRLELKDKYLFIYEWLEKMNVNECEHFYSNPFKTTVSVNTGDDLKNNDDSNMVKNESILFDKKRKVDPFENPKNHVIRDRLPKRLNSAFVLNDYYETNDKQTLAAKKDYLNCIKLKRRISLRPATSFVHETQANEKVVKEENYALIKEKLSKEKQLNDILLTRMKLDLFIL